MAPGFVIMQIGNPELDRLYERAVAPALAACGYEPRRVDRHNRGGLLVSEIIAFIDEAEVLVADLTNERPNCYLEVGYAIGVNKLTNLILTARTHLNEQQLLKVADEFRVKAAAEKSERDARRAIPRGQAWSWMNTTRSMMACRRRG